MEEVNEAAQEPATHVGVKEITDFKETVALISTTEGKKKEEEEVVVVEGKSGETCETWGLARPRPMTIHPRLRLLLPHGED